MLSVTRINLMHVQTAFSGMRRQTASCAYTLYIQSQTRSSTTYMITQCRVCYETSSTLKISYSLVSILILMQL